ncbi:MAG: hypothetical protein ACTSUF_05380 [Candidatus Heimdallarchaeaceae archaeon]
MVAKQMIKLMKQATVVGLIAGVLAAVLGPVLAQLSLPFMIDKIIILAAVIWVGTKARLVSKTFFDWAVLITAFAIVGGIIGALVPPVGSYVLSVGDEVTISGFLNLVLFVGLAQIVVNAAKLKF